MRSVSDSIPVERLWELYSYNPLTGQLWSKRTSRPLKGCECSNALKAHICWNGKRIQTNYGRAVYAWCTGAWPVNQIDHINRDWSDNRIQNLRDADSRLNNQNKRNYQGGVSYHHRHKKWFARITIQGKCKHLGTFPTKAEAQQAYLDALNALEAP